MNTYRCEYCEATYEHADVEDCPTVDGHCAHLMNDGWRPVWLHATIDPPREDAPRRRRVGRRRASPMGRHIFSRGGWICPSCVQRFAPRWARPKERRMVLVPDVHQEGRTR